MHSPKTSLFIIAFVSIAFVLAPVILPGTILHVPTYTEAGILDFLHSYTPSSIPAGNSNIEYDPVRGVKSLPIGNANQIKKTATDANKLNDSVSNTTGINFFKFFSWIWSIILFILDFFLNLLIRIFN